MTALARPEKIQVGDPLREALQTRRRLWTSLGHYVDGGGVAHPALRRTRVGEQAGQRVVDFGRGSHPQLLLGASRKPKPAADRCSCGSVIISIAISRWNGGITKRSSQVASAESL